MNSELLELLFSVKLKVTDEIIDHLPSPVRGKVREVRRSVLQAVHNATEEYLKDDSSSQKSGKKNSTVTSIPID